MAEINLILRIYYMYCLNVSLRYMCLTDDDQEIRSLERGYRRVAAKVRGVYRE